MNTSNILELVLNALIVGYLSNYIWNVMLETNFNFFNKKFHLSSIIIGLTCFINYFYVNSYIRIALITSLSILVIKFIYSIDYRKAIVTSIYFQVIMFTSELIYVLIILLLFRENSASVINNLQGKIFTNLSIIFLSLLISYTKSSKKIYNYLIKITDKISMSTLVIAFSVLIISVNLFMVMTFYKVNIATAVLINTCMIIVYSFIVFKFVQAKNRYIDISDKYSLSEASLKEVQNNVNRLMALNHENKNQLITIRTMVANKDKDVLKNIDAIIDQKIKDDKELKIRTSVISNTMLGSLIYSKLLTMKENNITHNLHISKDINKSHLINIGDKTNVDICKIIGVYLDNAIEAVMEAEVKEINIDLYLEDAYFCISIANTFKGKVDLDAITDYGYTTKSNGHGYGLSLVKEVIKDNNALSSKTDIIDNKVFVQNLKIKM